MNKWAYLSLATAVAVIGCGGGGGGSHVTTTTGSGVPGTSVSPTIGTTNAGGVKYGDAAFTYLTGQGRTVGDLTAIINHIQLTDSFGTASQSLGSQANLPLSQYTAQTLVLDVPFTTQNSRLFESYTQQFLSFLVSGESTAADPPAAMTFPARIRVFPGRETEVPVYLDDSMFIDQGTDPQSSVGADLIAYTYVTPQPTIGPETVFAYRNLNPALTTATAPFGEIPSFLGDYVGFNISSLPQAQRPLLTTGAYATELFVSGDNFAVVAPTNAGGNAGAIQVLTQDSTAPLIGVYGPQNSIQGMTVSGTYDLTQANPNLASPVSDIISLYGSWREYNTVLSGVGNFEMITFPNINDNNVQELVLIQRTNGNITNLYFGSLDTVQGLFQAFPVADVVSASAAGEIDGKIGNYVGKAGVGVSSPDQIRYGTYSIPSTSPITNQPQTLPSGFQSSGTFAVFRV